MAGSYYCDLKKSDYEIPNYKRYIVSFDPVLEIDLIDISQLFTDAGYSFKSDYQLSDGLEQYLISDYDGTFKIVDSNYEIDIDKEFYRTYCIDKSKSVRLSFNILGELLKDSKDYLSFDEALYAKSLGYTILYREQIYTQNWYVLSDTVPAYMLHKKSIFKVVNQKIGINGVQLTANDLVSIIQTSFGAYAFDLENYFSPEYNWESE